MKLKELSNKEIYLSPSVLAADFANLAEEVKKASDEGAELLHLDVMDGHLRAEHFYRYPSHPKPSPS